MRLSLSWLVLIIFGIIILILSTKGKKVYEAFQEKKEGFTSIQNDDIILTSCPANTKSFVDDLGNSVCCDGIIENGKCIGKEVCSITKGHSKYPTCGAYWAALLDQRGRDRCPTSMPTYFENMKTGVKGCAQGRRTKDGSAALPGVKFCRLYTSKTDEEEKLDSCFNQNRLDKAVCFKKPIPGVKKKLINVYRGVPPLIHCSYNDKGMVSYCGTNDSLHGLYKHLVKKGEENPRYATELPAYFKFFWCNQHEQVAIDKKLKIEDLKYVNLDTGVYSPPSKPVAPPKPAVPAVRAPAPLVAPKTPTLKKIGEEGQTLTVPPNSTVQYGANGKFVTRRVSGRFQATNQFFGRDPIPGVKKSVFLVN